MGSLLTPAELRKLIGVLGRLGSDFDGERAAAGLLASRLLRERGLTWDDLLGIKPMREGPRRNEACNQGLGMCLRHLQHLTEWEQGFCRSVATRSRLSSKQSEILSKIVAKLSVWGLD